MKNITNHTVDYIQRSTQGIGHSQGHALQAFRVVQDGLELTLNALPTPLSVWFSAPATNASSMECWYRDTDAPCRKSPDSYLLHQDWAVDDTAVVAAQIPQPDGNELVECRTSHLTEFALVPAVQVSWSLLRLGSGLRWGRGVCHKACVRVPVGTSGAGAGWGLVLMPSSLPLVTLHSLSPTDMWRTAPRASTGPGQANCF